MTLFDPGAPLYEACGILFSMILLHFLFWEASFPISRLIVHKTTANGFYVLHSSNPTMLRDTKKTMFLNQAEFQIPSGTTYEASFSMHSPIVGGLHHQGVMDSGGWQKTRWGQR